MRGIPGLRGSALAAALSIVTPLPAAALDCAFAVKMYQRVVAACEGGDSRACADLPLFERNNTACAADAPDAISAERAPAAEPAPPAPKPAPAEGDPLVREVQLLLAAAGFDPGVVDGKAGRTTCAAADAFASSRKIGVGCTDMVALREALKRALADAATAPPAGCALAERITDGHVIALWQERQGILVSVFEDHLRDLQALETALQGDLATLGRFRTAWRETVLTVKASSKLALGIGAAATALAGAPATAATLLGALAVIATAELADAAMRDWFGRALLDGSAPEIDTIELGDETIDQTLNGLIAIVEGSFEIKDIAERARKESETRALLREQIARQRRDIQKAAGQVRLNRGYMAFLATLQEARKTCAEANAEPQVLLP